MVSYGDEILVFGGVSRMSVDGETPFWIFNTGVCHCHSLLIHTPWSVQRDGQYDLVLPIDSEIASRTLDKKRPMYWSTHTRNISCRHTTFQLLNAKFSQKRMLRFC